MQEESRIALIIKPDLPPIEIDRVQIEQVLTNLIKNAIEVTPG